MAIKSFEELKDYCLRRLGAPVINIEADDVQLYERMNDAIAYFTERHYDGSVSTYYKHTVTSSEVASGSIILPADFVAVLDVLVPTSSSTGEPLFDIEYQLWQQIRPNAASLSVSNYYITKMQLGLINNLLSQSRSFEFNSTTHELVPLWNLSDAGSGNLLKSADDLTADVWAKGNVAITSGASDPRGGNNGFVVQVNNPGSFSISQTYPTTTYVRGTVTTAMYIQAGTFSGTLTITISDAQGNVVATKDVIPGTNWNYESLVGTFGDQHGNDVVVTISGTTALPNQTFNLYSPTLYNNATIVVHGYRAVDPQTTVDLFNNRWIQEYTTALFKKQWGQNIKKFDGVQLPGGVTMNGQQIYDEAVEEIRSLEEQFSLTYELPVDFFWG